MSVLYLTENEVRRLLTMDDALLIVEAAFRKLSLDEAENVPRRRCRTDHVMLHVLPAAVRTLNAIGFKAYTTGKFPATFHVYLFDPKVGGLTAILEADYLGQVRTGAASGVATKLLARPDAQTVGLFGTGRQARTQLEAVCKVRTITRAVVYSRNEERRTAFAKEMSQTCKTEVVPAEKPEDAAKGLDIIITATTSREPVLFGSWVSEGMHLNLIGSNFLAKAETDSEVFRKATLITADSVEQAKLEAGDFVAAMRDGVIGWSDVYEFGHVLAGRYPGRQSATEITVFKSLGLGIEDVAVAARVVEKAQTAGMGQKIL
jgi:ornithine cyclodeaminase/alanine dehydrogenase-like protein (mu-crystallin family)